jgi:hypothetical protein
MPILRGSIMADQDTTQQTKKEPIKVTDRRSFTLDGLPRSSEPKEPEPAPDTPIVGEGFQMREGPAEGRPPQPGVDFNSFILSLSSTAFIHLGEIEDPMTRRKEVRLEAARQIIDIIDMLREKTRGNLEPHEERFIEGILYEMKVKYTEKASGR